MRIAITGGIAEGKSTVLGYLAEMGFKTSSADQIAREVFDDPATNAELARIVGVSPPMERGTLRERLFADPAIRHAVNRVTHPLITQRIARSDAEFIEVPLLLEGCIQGLFDAVWVVTCGPEEQERRLRERYGESADLRAIVSSQLPTRVKIPFADTVIRTNCAPDSVSRNVSEALKKGIELG